MPARTDLKSILIIGSGPIVIGQACEFDYSGTQALQSLRKLGYHTILVNSNPATIMTDPNLADATYIEPLSIDYLESIIATERPDAVLPTMGGQTALNLARDLSLNGILAKYNVELIGASFESIDVAEDRGRFQSTMRKIGLDVPRGGIAHSIAEAEQVIQEVGLPAIIRPAYTLGGWGGATAFNQDEFQQYVRHGLSSSPVNQVIIEESLLGWKEFELEVMRDHIGNVVIVCSIENFDPLGVHTGDSITVAPAQTLTDKEYQLMRNAAIEVMRAVGVDSGGSNIQFGIHPQTGRMVVIEMNPRVSRSSALASKATGYPIAKVASQLAVGMTLGEIPNEITGRSVSAFEPTLDYVVVKIPRWAFEKFPHANRILGPTMKSIGEVMAIGRTFPEALQKAIRGLDIGRSGLGSDGADPIIAERVESYLRGEWREFIQRKLRVADPNRIFFIRYALDFGFSASEINSLTGIDPWFIHRIQEMIEVENELHLTPMNMITAEILTSAKRNGYSDVQIAHIKNTTTDKVSELRHKFKVFPNYRSVDTCAGEFDAQTPYYYSTYGEQNEAASLGNKTVLIIGSGPNRIGQGIEFDYCCVQAVLSLREAGYRTVMINNNPETVSTDYDLADRLYFEPITLEDVLNIVEAENPFGVILQFGGGTPLKLAAGLAKFNVRILGTPQDSIDLTEDRQRFASLLAENNIDHPPFSIADTIENALESANRIGYPVLIRPSYVLGGRAMEIVYDNDQLKKFFYEAMQVSSGSPILIDRFIEDAFEFDVDALSDGDDCLICGIMQHIEEAGIHSGDSACVLPPYMLSDEMRQQIKSTTRLLVKRLGVIGMLNLQFALRDDKLYVIEVNPRASRTVPFVSKATGIPWAKIGARILVGQKINDIIAGDYASIMPKINQQKNLIHQDDFKLDNDDCLSILDDVIPDLISVKACAFPFNRFDNVNYFLGPEMRSTGEVMGIGATFGEAFYKAQSAINAELPLNGGVFISVNNRDKTRMLPIAKALYDLGFEIFATTGTNQYLNNTFQNDSDHTQISLSKPIYKVNEGRPNIVDLIKNGKIKLIINTPLGKESYYDEKAVGYEAFRRSIPNITTLSGAWAAVQAIQMKIHGKIIPVKLQDIHNDFRNRRI